MFGKAAAQINVLENPLLICFILYIVNKNFHFQALLFTAYDDKSDLRREVVLAIDAVKRMKVHNCLISRYCTWIKWSKMI